MDGGVTSLANDQGFTSVLEHDLRPKRLISSHRGQIGKPVHLMNHALLVFDGAEFTGARYESSYYLPSLIDDHGGYLIDQDSLWISYQRNTSKSGNEWFLPVASLSRRFQTCSRTVRGINSGSEAFRHGFGGTVILSCKRVSQGLLDNPSVSIEPADIGGKQIVLDKTPVFILRGFQDGLIGAGSQRETPQRFSCVSVGRDFLPPHFFGNA